MDNRRDLRILPAMLTAVLLLCLAAHQQARGGEPEPAPDFELADLHGTVHRLSDHANKVVVINFWATWCPECIVEIPSLNAFAEQFGNRDVVVLTVSMDKSRATLEQFLQEHPVTMPVMLDRAGEVYIRKYHIRGLPATVVIDRQGRIAAKLLGGQEFMEKEFIQKVEKLLAAKP